MFSAREKNNIYLMDAEQKVFTFHASGLKPILDQEGTFPASEIERLGKCLVLTTLLSPSRHHPRSPSQGCPHTPSAPKFVHQPCFTHPPPASPTNLNLVVLLSDGSALLNSSSTSAASQTLRENLLQCQSCECCLT